MLAESDLSHQAAENSLPLQDAFAVMFFVSVGMNLDVVRFLEAPLTILAVATLVIAIKSVIIYWLSRPFGLNAAEAAETGLLLGPGGEFALVILGSAALYGAIEMGIGTPEVPDALSSAP